jgi:hypothetical protein
MDDDTSAMFIRLAASVAMLLEKKQVASRTEFAEFLKRSAQATDGASVTGLVEMIALGLEFTAGEIPERN